MAVITESFNKANSDILGPDLSWTELAGDIDIVSNRAQSTTLGVQVVARANSDLATLNQYVQASVNASEETTGAAVGLVLRKDSTATLTFYLFSALYNTNQVFIIKQIAGSNTTLATAAVTLTAGTPVLLRGEVQGTALRLLVDSVEVATATDGDIAAGLRTGLRGNKTAIGFVTWDSFEAGDILANEEVQMRTGIPNVDSLNGRLKASQLNAVSLPTGIPNVFADGSGNLCVTATPVGAGFPTGYPGVRANADGRLRIATTPVGTLKPSGIPNVDADSNGSIHVEITTTDPSDLPTGIPGVQASADRRLRVILEN